MAGARRVGMVLPEGFKASGVHCGIKHRRKDLALIVSESDAVCAVAYTTNSVRAAPVQVSMQNLGEVARCIVVNSGNANALTGERGVRDAWRMVEECASLLDVPREKVGVASTGVIGRPLPMDAVVPGIRAAFDRLGRDQASWRDAAEAIMTTDTFPKRHGVEVELQEGPVRVSGIAKGAGMVHPEMRLHHATTLVFVTTDAIVPKGSLNDMTAHALDRSLNLVSVDGDTSTNDTCMVLANGASGVAPSGPRDLATLKDALTDVFRSLATMVARDGEGAERLITVRVVGAGSEKDARTIARRIASSNLVKSAVWGCEPNPGRIAAAAGMCGTPIDPESMCVYIGGGGSEVCVMDSGEVLEGVLSRAKVVMASSTEVVIRLVLNGGRCSATAWGCDLTPRYVEINGGHPT